MKTLMLAVIFTLNSFHPFASIEAAQTEKPDCKHWQEMWDALKPGLDAYHNGALSKLLALYPGPSPAADLSSQPHESRQATLTRLMSSNSSCANLAYFEAKKLALRSQLSEAEKLTFRALVAEETDREQQGHADLTAFSLTMRTLQTLTDQKWLNLNQAEEFELARIWSETKQLINLVHLQLDFSCTKKKECEEQTIDHELKRIRFQSAETDRLYSELKHWTQQVHLNP